MRLFEFQDDMWYHGSSDALIAASETHLNPGQDGAVWLTKDMRKAQRYARLTADKVGGNPIIVDVLDSNAPQDPTNYGDDWVRAVADKVQISRILKLG